MSATVSNSSILADHDLAIRRFAYIRQLCIDQQRIAAHGRSHTNGR